MDEKMYYPQAAWLITQPFTPVRHKWQEQFFLQKMALSAAGHEQLLLAVNDVMVATLMEQDARPVHAFEFIDNSRKHLKDEKFKAYRDQAAALLDKVVDTVMHAPSENYNQALVDKAAQFQKTRRGLKSAA